jgi:hypothetical protein
MITLAGAGHINRQVRSARREIDKQESTMGMDQPRRCLYIRYHSGYVRRC